MQQYLNRLHVRMIRRGFTHVDPLLQHVGRVMTELQDLSMELHYMTCDDVWRTTPHSSPGKLSADSKAT